MARSSRGPLVALFIVALVPAIGFTGLWRWAASHDTEPDPSEFIPDAPEPTGPPAPELTTALASLRRAPGPIAEMVALEVGRDERVDRLGALFDGLPDELSAASCARVDLTDARFDDTMTLADLGAGRSVVPASTQKLLVATVALEVLGAEARLVTEVRGAPVVDGVVEGDLFVVGGGDPLLRSDEVPIPRALDVVVPTRFDDLVDQLVEAGVTRIEGDLVGDGGRYGDEFIVPSWGEAITRDDGGPVGGLLVNDGRIVGAGVGLNPGQSAMNELARLLNERGITVVGGNRTGETPDGIEVLASVESAPIGELVAEMLLTSDNQIAEMTLREIGYELTGDGSRVVAADALREVLGARGVDLGDSVLDDGSGLSRVNALTCAALVEVLQTEPVDGALAEALPVAGTSGTLRSVFVGEPAEGVLRAKTGTLTGVKALAGFVPIESGSVARFAILLEGPDANDPAVHEPIWAALVETLLDPWPEPDLAAVGPR